MALPQREIGFDFLQEIVSDFIRSSGGDDDDDDKKTARISN